MLVTVTSGDIRAGKKAGCAWWPAGPEDCPVAVAVRRAFRSRCTVFVDEIYGWDEDWNARVFPLPAEAKDFIERWDKTQKGEPFSFEVG